MRTIDEKVDLIMRYIVSNDWDEADNIKEQIADILNSENSKKSVYVQDEIHKMLNELGIRQSLLGHTYLTTAIELCLGDGGLIRRGVTALYSDIADEHNTAGSRIERAIRHSIQEGMTCGDLDIINRVFGSTIDSDKARPTNKHFIVACVDEMRRRLR